MTGKIGNIPNEVKERLEKINKHSDNLVKLINDLLDIARIESGHSDMKIEEHNILSIIDIVHDLLTPQLKEKNIQWQVTAPEATPPIKLDRSLIERVFINLIGNAVKFTRENGTISVKIEYDENHMTIHVSDTGIGIKEEDIPKLFNEFYRVENEINANIKGSGLGLSLAKNIIEVHQGTLSVDSKVNEGTTFRFTIPFERKPEIEES
jgi:signal transduction histidine kinase